jgi:galactokinase
MYDPNVVKKSIATHTKTYGTEPTTVAYAPGRIEVLGNHTDYNEGTVLSAAINMAIASAFRNRKNRASALLPATCMKPLSSILQTARGSL